MPRELLFYQNILKVCLHLSILASSGFSNSKNYQIKENRKAACNRLRKETKRFKIHSLKEMKGYGTPIRTITHACNYSCMKKVTRQWSKQPKVQF